LEGNWHFVLAGALPDPFWLCGNNNPPQPVKLRTYLINNIRFVLQSRYIHLFDEESVMKSKKGISIIWISMILVLLLAACSSPKVTPDPNSAKPSKPGGTGEALNLTGNVANGEVVFVAKCVECHGKGGTTGVANEGSTDGTVPNLNPIDDTMKNADPKVFAANIDLFLEHGSTPEGDNPSKVMQAFGDTGILKPQEIADVIAYVISLNK
jgi:mono/diheme cytochrome c family protein